jgi:GntR family transcriptional regulator
VVARFFDVPAGSTVWRFLRIHSLDGTPLSVVDSYLPVKYGSAITRADLKAPMHDLLWDRFRLRQSRSEHAIHVARADIDIATHLQIALADPVLAIEARVYLDDGMPIRWIHNAFREDRYEYVAEMDWPAPSNFPGLEASPLPKKRKQKGVEAVTRRVRSKP